MATAKYFGDPAGLAGWQLDPEDGASQVKVIGGKTYRIGNDRYAAWQRAMGGNNPWQKSGNRGDYWRVDPATGRKIRMSADAFRDLSYDEQLGLGQGQNGAGSEAATPQAQGQGTQAGSSAAAQAAQGAAKNWGVAAGMNNGMTPGELRDENVYARRDGDSTTNWAQRVFRTSTGEFGPEALNPNLAENPLAGSPFARWYQSRYGVAAPINQMVASMISGDAPTSPEMKGWMQGAQQGTRSLGPMQMNDATGNLAQVGKRLQSFADGKTEGWDPYQIGVYGSLLNDPEFAGNIVQSQLRGATGGWGMDYIGQMMKSMADGYYDDPANNGPDKMGPYFNQILKKIGVL